MVQAIAKCTRNGIHCVDAFDGIVAPWLFDSRLRPGKTTGDLYNFFAKVKCLGLCDAMEFSVFLGQILTKVT